MANEIFFFLIIDMLWIIRSLLGMLISINRTLQQFAVVLKQIY